MIFINEFNELINILAPQIANCIIPVIVSSAIYSVGVTKYSLNKVSKYEGHMISEMPPILKVYSDEEREIIQNEIVKTTKEFLLPVIEKLKGKVNGDNLNIFYNNIKNLDLKQNPLLLLMRIGGYYSPSNNELNYALRKYLEHEFVHMCTSIYDEKNNVIYSGFGQYQYINNEYSGKRFGDQLNEGYTELLTSRMFYKSGAKGKAYKKQIKIARLLELFFDDPKEMEALFFKCNMPGLIKHLEQYAPKEEVIKLIAQLDATREVRKLPFGSLNFMPKIVFAKAEMELYKWFKAQNKDPNKLKQFTNILSEDKYLRMAMNKEFKLEREQLDNDLKQGKAM